MQMQYEASSSPPRDRVWYLLCDVWVDMDKNIVKHCNACTLCGDRDSFLEPLGTQLYIL